jgi:tRNA-dihydrouridine synthase B
MAFSWYSIKKPIVALAPMSGVSDIALRTISRRLGSDIEFSEFISTDAVHYKCAQYLGIGQPKGIQLDKGDIIRCASDDEFWKDDKSMVLATFIEEERPFIIQVFGNEPEHFDTAVRILNHRFKPDGFDINFGCPARSVVNNGAGSCLFLVPDVAKKIIETVKLASGNIPTSIKLRASYKHVSCMEFLRAIEGAPYENITVHMRTYEQVHHGPVNLERGKEVVDFAHRKGISCIVNGGIDSGIKAKQALDETLADGIMIAQGSLGNPFIFKQIKNYLAIETSPKISWTEKIDTIKEHAELMLEHKGERGIIEMRKHLVWYFKGFPGASEIRAKLVSIQSMDELVLLLDSLKPTDTQIIPAETIHIAKTA